MEQGRDLILFQGIRHLLTLVDTEVSQYAYVKLRKLIPEYLGMGIPCFPELADFIKKEMKRERPFYPEKLKRANEWDPTLDRAMLLGVYVDTYLAINKQSNKTADAFPAAAEYFGVADEMAKDHYYKYWKSFVKPKIPDITVPVIKKDGVYHLDIIKYFKL